jgi:hypothetical protein
VDLTFVDLTDDERRALADVIRTCLVSAATSDAAAVGSAVAERVSIGIEN